MVIHANIVIENDKSAILYTGDIRSEPWFVNNLTRNPFLIKYTCGLNTLDCIYLDTTNVDPIKFPTKAEGLRELLQKVSKYPADTVFHFEAWTFGYEDVWMALAHTLKSQVSSIALPFPGMKFDQKSRSMLINTNFECIYRLVAPQLISFAPVRLLLMKVPP
jgi:hypothetical protein